MTHPWEHTIRSHRQMLDGLERAVQRPSLAEPVGPPVPRDNECVRCLNVLDPGRTVICTACWKDNR